MMGRRVSGWMGVALGAAMALPGSAEAQIRVHVDWQWSSDGRTGARVYADGRYGYRIPRIGVVRYQPVRYVRVTGVRIPRGFRPARGMCRLWYPGLAPGLQPRPVRCEALRGRFHPDVLVVTWRGVLRPVWDGYERVRYANARVVDYRWRGDRYSWNDAYDRYDRYDRYHRGSRRGDWNGDRWEEWDDDDWWEDDERGDDRLRRDERLRRDDDARSRGNRNGVRSGDDRGRTDRPGQRNGRGRAAVNGRGPGG